MLLFLVILIICFLLTIASDITKFLKISRLWDLFQNKSHQFSNLEHELKNAKEELERIKNTTNMGEYALLIKKMRAEQKINDIRENIDNEKKLKRLRNVSIDIFFGYILKGFFSLTLLLISIWNRKTPVMIFDERFNLQPLEGLLSFPTGIAKAISTPVWILSCNITFRWLNSLLR